MERKKIQQGSIFKVYSDVLSNEKSKVGHEPKVVSLEKRQRNTLKDINNVKTLKFDFEKATSSTVLESHQPNYIKAATGTEDFLNKKGIQKQENEKSPKHQVFKKSEYESLQEFKKKVLSLDSEINYPYAKDIYKNLRSIEALHQPNLFMKKQLEISESDRAKSVDWMAGIIERLHLQTETLYLSVSYLNRFLCNSSVTSNSLKIAAIAAMIIASKFQEVYPLRVNDLLCVSNEAYTKSEILKMEWSILKTLTFNVATPTSLAFLGCYCGKLSKEVKYLSMYLCELSLFETESYKFLPSYLVAAAVALAQHTLGEEIWPQELIFLSGYRLRYLKFGICSLSKTFKDASNQPQKITKRKYESKDYCHVSLLLPKTTSMYGFEDDD